MLDRIPAILVRNHITTLDNADARDPFQLNAGHALTESLPHTMFYKCYAEHSYVPSFHISQVWTTPILEERAKLPDLKGAAYLLAATLVGV